MRIGIITPGYSRDDSDWAIPVLRHLIRELTSQHEVTIFTLRHPNLRGIYFVDGVKVIAFGGGTAGGIGRIPLYARVLRAIVNEASFDLLHGFWADEPSFLAVLAGKKMGIPVVASVFGGELVNLPDIAYGGARSRINRQLSRYALKHADIVTAGSDFVADIARNVMPAAKIVRWSQGVTLDANVAKSERSENGTLRLLHVGALTPVKDQGTLLRAFAAISAERPNTQLTIAGMGRLHRQLMQQVAKLGLTQKVHFLGHVDHKQMMEVYQSAELLLLTSRHESQAMVLLEAVANGCPVIGTRVGLIPELVPPELIAPPQDARSLANATVHLLTDDNARDALYHSQLTQLQNRFTLQRTTTQICDIYNSLT